MSPTTPNNNVTYLRDVKAKARTFMYKHHQVTVEYNPTEKVWDWIADHQPKTVRLTGHASTQEVAEFDAKKMIDKLP